jgi:hypothetical protein
MKHSIDWLSIKLNAVCLLGLISTNMIAYTFTILATLTTIVYNVIKITQELKTKKPKDEISISES